MTINRKQNSDSSPNWLEIDILGLRRTLERKGKAWAVFELVQNSWDTSATRVDVTLTKPRNGRSTLICRDNSPEGYRDLSESRTLFAASRKKADPTKRGRFNAGEKFVLVMCEQAKVTSTTGQIIFQPNGKCKMTDVCLPAGTEFQGVLEMTEEEWLEVGSRVQLLLPPITTTYNGVEIARRPVLRSFYETLTTEIANDRGVLTPRKRKTEVNIYQVLDGEQPMIYERGIPVVEMDGKYHVSVEQKIPLNTERDNVTPSYLRSLHTIVAAQTADLLTSEDANKPWVRTAVETGKLSDEVVKAIAEKRFGPNAVLFDHTDKGSNKEATSKGATVIPARGAISAIERKVFLKSGALLSAGDIEAFKTNPDQKPAAKTLTDDDHDDDQRQFIKLIETVSPMLINHNVTVKIVDDGDLKMSGCTRWKKNSFEFEINAAHHDTSDWQANYELLIHELAHHKVQSNDHLCREFYDTVTELGAKLAQLCLDQPALFPTIQLQLEAAA